MMDLNSGKLLSGNKNYSQSIRLILCTPKGERVLNRSFGSEVVMYLDQPLNIVAIEIAAEVISGLQSCDSRIEVDDVQVINNNGNGLTINVNYNGQQQTSVSF